MAGIKIKKNLQGASELAQQVKESVSKFDSQSSIPRTQHMVEGDIQLPKVVV